MKYRQPGFGGSLEKSGFHASDGPVGRRTGVEPGLSNAQASPAFCLRVQVYLRFWGFTTRPSRIARVETLMRFGAPSMTAVTF